MLREYTSRGVQVVSPLTLGQKLELVKAGVHAQRLSEEALAVQERLQRLGQRFDEFADDWDTCVRHLSNAKDRADDADAAFERLRSEFDRIDSLSLDGGDDATVREPLSRGRGAEPSSLLVAFPGRIGRHAPRSPLDSPPCSPLPSPRVRLWSRPRVRLWARRRVRGSGPRTSRRLRHGRRWRRRRTARWRRRSGRPASPPRRRTRPGPRRTRLSPRTGRWSRTFLSESIAPNGVPVPRSWLSGCYRVASRGGVVWRRSAGRTRSRTGRTGRHWAGCEDAAHVEREVPADVPSVRPSGRIRKTTTGSWPTAGFSPMIWRQWSSRKEVQSTNSAALPWMAIWSRVLALPEALTAATGSRPAGAAGLGPGHLDGTSST